MKPALAFITISMLIFLLGPAPVLALDPSLDVSQLGHTAWTARDGLTQGAIKAKQAEFRAQPKIAIGRLGHRKDGADG